MESKDGDVALETSHLLLLLGEPLRCGSRQVAMDFARQGLRRWDGGVVSAADLSAALDTVANVKPTPTKVDRAPGDETIATYSGFGVSVTVVFNCRIGGVRRLLASTLRHAHYALVIFAGSCDSSTGAWLLADGVFAPSDLDVLSVAASAVAASSPTTAEVEPRRLHLHLPVKGEFPTLRDKMTSYRLDVTDAADAFEPLELEFDFTANVMETVEREVRAPHEDTLLSTPGVVGALGKKDLTVYVFPAEDGDCFLISVRGFTMLVNGGHAARSCFWPLIGSLDSLDVLAITHLGHDNIQGLSTLLSRKLKDGASVPPHIDHLFFNALEFSKGGEGETNGESPPEGLGVSLAVEGKRFVEQLHTLDLTPHPFVQPAKDPATPIELYCKIGFGRLSMYLIHPTEGGQELMTFLAQWKAGDFAKDQRGFPVPDQASVAFLLVWYPDNPKKTPTRMLYPGRCSPDQLAAGLDRLKDVPVMRSFDGKPPPPTVNKTAPSASKGGKPDPSKEKSPRPTASQARRPGAMPGKRAADEVPVSGATAAKNGPSPTAIKKTTASKVAVDEKKTSSVKTTATTAAKKEVVAAKKESSTALKKEPVATVAKKESTSAAAKKETAAPAKRDAPMKKELGKEAAKKEPMKKEAAVPAKKEVMKASPRKEPAAAAVAKKEAPSAKPTTNGPAAAAAAPAPALKAKSPRPTKAAEAKTTPAKTPTLKKPTTPSIDKKKSPPTPTKNDSSVAATIVPAASAPAPATVADSTIPTDAITAVTPLGATISADVFAAEPERVDPDAKEATPEPMMIDPVKEPPMVNLVNLVSETENEESADIGTEANLDADQLAERARRLLSYGDVIKGELSSENVRIEITTCDSAPDSEEEDFQPLIEEKPEISTASSNTSVEAKKGSTTSFETTDHPPLASANALAAYDDDHVEDDDDDDDDDHVEDDVPLHGRKSPISRISKGGNVYPESADSPNSFASLDTSDIGVKGREGLDDIMDTPKSIEADDIPFSRFFSKEDDDVNDFDDNVDDDLAHLKIETAPVVSNPFSGDEASLEASSPESLSPNAPLEDVDDQRGDQLIDPPSSSISKTKTTKSDLLFGDGVDVGVEELQAESPDAESGFAELSAASKIPGLIDGIESKEYRAIAEMSSDSDSLLTASHNSPMDDFDPFAASPSLKPMDGGCEVSPCPVLAPQMSGLSLYSVDSLESPSAVNGASLTASSLMEDLVGVAGISAGKEGSPFGNNGFPEAKAFNELVQQQQQQQVSPGEEPSFFSLSATAPAFAPTNGNKLASLSPDAPAFVPSTIPEEEAAAIVDSWGPPMGLPPAKPAAPGARPKTQSGPAGAKPKPGTAASRPGTTSRRTASPASSTASGHAGRRAPGAVPKKGGSAKPTPPPPSIIPCYVDVAYVPTQGKAEVLGKFFSRVRAKNYVLSCVDSPALTLDALLNAKEHDWKIPASSAANDSGDAATVIPTLVIPTHEGETLRSWIPNNLDRMTKLGVEIATPAEKCTLQLHGHDEVRSACYALTCN